MEFSKSDAEAKYAQWRRRRREEAFDESTHSRTPSLLAAVILAVGGVQFRQFLVFSGILGAFLFTVLLLRPR